MNDHLPDCLTAQHLQLFGAIVQWFARYELLMQEIMAALCGTDAAAVMLLTRRLDFGGKRATLLDLLRQRRIPMDQFDRICAYLLIPHTYAPLRHDVAHSAWTSSQHSGSVQPNWIIGLPSGITPLQDDFNALTETFIERSDMEFNYTIGDLKEIVRILADNHEALSDYIHEVGMVRISRT